MDFSLADENMEGLTQPADLIDKCEEINEAPVYLCDWDPSNMSNNTLFLDDNMGKFKDLFMNDNNESINFLMSEKTVNMNNTSLLKILVPHGLNNFHLDEIKENIQDENEAIHNDSRARKESEAAAIDDDSPLANHNSNTSFSTHFIKPLIEEKTSSVELNTPAVQEVINELVEKVTDIVAKGKNSLAEWLNNSEDNQNSNYTENKILIISPRESDATAERLDKDGLILSANEADQKLGNPFASDYSLTQSRDNGLSIIAPCENQSDHVYYLSNATFNNQQNSDAGLMKSTMGKFNPDSIFRINDRIDNSFVPDLTSKKHSFQRNANSHGKNSQAGPLNFSHDLDNQISNFEESVQIDNQNFTFVDKSSGKLELNDFKAVLQNLNSAPLKSKKTQNQKLNDLEEIKSISEENEDGEFSKMNTKPNISSQDEVSYKMSSDNKIPIKSDKENEFTIETTNQIDIKINRKDHDGSLPNEEDRDSFIEEIDKQIRISNIKIQQRPVKSLNNIPKEFNRVETDQALFEELLKPKMLNSNQDSYKLSLDLKESKSRDNRKNYQFDKIENDATIDLRIAKQVSNFKSDKEIQEKVSQIEESQRERIKVLLVDNTPQISEITPESENQTIENSPLEDDTSRCLTSQPYLNETQNSKSHISKLENVQSDSSMNYQPFTPLCEMAHSTSNNSNYKNSIPTDTSSHKIKDSCDIIGKANEQECIQSEAKKVIIKLFKKNSLNIVPILKQADLVPHSSNIVPHKSALHFEMNNEHTAEKKGSLNRRSRHHTKTSKSPEITKCFYNSRSRSFNKPVTHVIAPEPPVKPKIHLFKKTPAVRSNYVQPLKPFVNAEPQKFPENHQLGITSNLNNLITKKDEYASQLTKTNLSKSPIQFHSAVQLHCLQVSDTTNSFHSNVQQSNNNPAYGKVGSYVSVCHLSEMKNDSQFVSYCSKNSDKVTNHPPQILTKNSFQAHPSSYWVNHKSSVPSLVEFSHHNKNPPQITNQSSKKSTQLPAPVTPINKISDEENGKIHVAKKNEQREVSLQRKSIYKRLSKSPIATKDKMFVPRNFSINLKSQSEFFNIPVCNGQKSQTVHVINNNSVLSGVAKTARIIEPNLKTVKPQIQGTQITSNGQKSQSSNKFGGISDINVNQNQSKPLTTPKMNDPRSDVSPRKPPETKIIQGKQAVLIRVDSDGREIYRYT
jgi:hypothetical protein